MRCKDLPAACQDRVLRKVPLADSLRIIGRGSSNWLAHRPIVVSFEVTDACSCWCKHCDHGGRRDESRNLKPADYRRYMQALRPCVVQVSGGESLLRDDVADIVRAIQDGDTLPYTILVSNWSDMTEGLYFALRTAGVNQFSVSLDFPDSRHDAFRVYSGLYRHLEDLSRAWRDSGTMTSSSTPASPARIWARSRPSRTRHE